VREIQIRVERLLDAPAPVVYRCLADYQNHHYRFLPSAFSEYRVEHGGMGSGTVISYLVTAGGRARRSRDVISEPEPGRILVETDAAAGKVTTFTLEPRGERTLLRIETRFRSSGGPAGVFQPWLAPRLLRPIYEDELERLNRYATALRTSEAHS
jgi:uncharacterized protein YndB with AHSA1/START domain